MSCGSLCPPGCDEQVFFSGPELGGERKLRGEERCARADTWGGSMSGTADQYLGQSFPLQEPPWRHL